MKHESLPKRIWRVLYPILILFAVTNAVVLSATLRWDWSAGTVWLNDDFLNAHYLPMAMAGWALAAAPAAFLFYRDRLRADSRVGPGGARADLHSGPRLSPVFFLCCTAQGLAACVFFNSIIALWGLQAYSPGYGEVSGMLYSQGLAWKLAALAVAAPLAEELIFRGLGFWRLRGWLGFWPAAMASSLLFGLYHFNLVQLVYAFLLGMLLAAVYERSGSLLAPVLLHAAANASSVLLTEIPLLRGLTGGPLALTMTAAVSGLALAGTLWGSIACSHGAYMASFRRSVRVRRLSSL